MKKIMFVSLLIATMASTVLQAGEIAPVAQSENEGLLYSTLWMQTAAEYRACAYQAYNYATLLLQQDMQKNYDKPRAIIVDVDETVIDNSVYEAWQIKDNIKYPEKFDDWINSAEGYAIPGAKEFLNFAADSGYEVFYVSNRKLRHLEGTRENLEKLGYPFADLDHMLFKDKISSKQPRRDKVMENFELVLLMGDNLIDFSDLFAGTTVEDRFEAVDKMREEFGKKFVILPNAMHGKWMKVLLNNRYDCLDRNIIMSLVPAIVVGSQGHCSVTDFSFPS